MITFRSWRPLLVVGLSALLLAAAQHPIGVLEHTAVAALHDLRLQPHSAEWEYSGFIIRRGNAYLYTASPHTDRTKDMVIVNPLSYLQLGDKLVAIYHNHPCYSTTHYTNYFSMPDLFQAWRWNVPAFLLDNCTGLVHEFDGSVDKISDTGANLEVRTTSGEDKQYKLPTGRIVGDIGITSENLDEPEITGDLIKHMDSILYVVDRVR